MKNILSKITSSILLAFALLFGATIMPNTFLTPSVYAEEEPSTSDNPTEEGITEPSDTDEGEPSTDPDNTEETDENDEDSEDEDGLSDVANACQEQTGSLAWLVCPGSGVIATATDSLYGAITDMLEVAPLSMEDSSPIYVIWKYARSITNSLFAILLIIVIFSQITGIGLNNYGVKRILPRLIIAVVLVNLSYIICTLAVDASNIAGDSLRKLFENIQTEIIKNADMTTELADFSISGVLATVISGGSIAGITINALGGGGYIFFMLLTVIIGALIAVVSGLATIAARQALVALLVMVSPLAVLAYLLPNTEGWFNKWKNLLARMLFFYPIFSFLFGASQLIGYALIISANNPIGIILGIAVQIFPLFFSWSLMKMSGTILGTVNNAVRRIASPIQRGLSGWSLSMAEQRRQHHLANSQTSGARLRRYLDYRQKLRELDTTNSTTIRQGKATERAFKVASSSTGRDANGNLSWKRYANDYTSNAKMASTYDLRAKTAESAHKNTLSQYGDIFTSRRAAQLSDESGESYLEAMSQEFLTKNNAQADQDWLLNKYLNAAIGEESSPYQYNRLIKSAAGALGHNGESSIMGQVITGNSMIEQRRRSEARIIINKFGVNKTQFRAMLLDKASINDNGFETDEYGEVIEDDQYRLLPGKTHRGWQYYRGVHKETGKEITKEEYDALSDSERSQYRKVRYMHITNDEGGKLQYIFDDDAGYMKELLTDDINIGDPINRRYLTEIGVPASEGESTGILRRYHSTIAAALLASQYKNHASEVTPMLVQQANNGFINSIGQYNIANLQSISVATKSSAFLQNDSYAVDTWTKLLVNSVKDDVVFSHYFPDQDIMNYRNVNGVKLGGMILDQDENGNQYWRELSAVEMEGLNTTETLEAKKNLLKHKIFPKAITKLVSMANRNVSNSTLENQKGDTLKSLVELFTGLDQIGLDNINASIPFEQRVDGNKNLYDSPDPGILKRIIRATQQAIEKYEAGQDDTTDDQSANNNSRQAVDDLLDSLKRQFSHQQLNSPDVIQQTIEQICNSGMHTNQMGDMLVSFFEELSMTADQDTQNDLAFIIDQYRFPDNPTSINESIDQIVYSDQESQERANNMQEELLAYLRDHFGL